MYNPIQLTIPEVPKSYMENFNLNIGSKDEIFDIDHFYTEAVFAKGKETLAPLVEHIQKIKDELEEKISAQEKDATKKFDPKQYWKSLNFKAFEDELKKIFGMRNVNINPWIERYDSKAKVFESKECNCVVYTMDRFPIDGLVTDKGFYDKTHSVISDIHISLGLIRALTAEEILAVILHEFGHNIDPALVDIKYAEANILSKYMTDRKKAISSSEKKAMKKFHKGNGVFGFTKCVIHSLGWSFDKFISNFKSYVHSNSVALSDLFASKSKKEEKKINRIRELIKADKEEFNRQNYSEAFADNFARMYGYGPQLMSALRKLSKSVESQINSRYQKEKARQNIIFYITESTIKDVHKTDVHRARALLKEYDNDLNDPNIPAAVKKDIKADRDELEKVLNEYLHNFSDLQNRINNAINDELVAMESKSTPVAESVEEFTESKRAREKIQKEMDAITPAENKLFHDIFDKALGKRVGCSLAKDKDGYYVRTHRARSKSYERIEDIPVKDVEFVDSTC